MQVRLFYPPHDEDIEAIVASANAQNEESYYRPQRTPLEIQQPNPLNNVFFGDLHIHTNASVDAYLFGNRFDMDTAYQVAKGRSVVLRTGERVELTRPLDFAALTDHAEGFGRRLACLDPSKSEEAQEVCDKFARASLITFLELRNRGPQRDLTVFNNDSATERKYAASTWQLVLDSAERNYEPGKFTTFAGYEYSPVLPDRGKHHRNIIFRSLDTPKYAVSSFDAASEIDLWKELESTCTKECEVLDHSP